MLILPGEHRYRVLPWVPNREWREPSLAQPKDCFGRQNRVRFRFIAKGCVPWIGWCDSREDADAFLNAMLRATYLGEPVPYSIWRLPTPHWYPDVGTEVWWATTQLLISPTGSNQTLTSPSDWGNPNSVELLAAGGSGGAGSGTFHATGGGGGEYGITNNFPFASPGTTTATYQIGTGGIGKGAVATALAGANGGDTWWNGTTQAGATLGAIHGNGGAVGTGSQNGGAGGTGGVGSTHSAGGRGGNLTGASGTGASGAGGAGGSTGAGNQGVDSTSTGSSVATAGGSGDGGSGGSLGTGGTTGGDGGTGTEFGGTDGSGGGGGGAAGSGNASAGRAGNYGAGGGAANTTTTGNQGTSRAGATGVIFITYTPVVSMPFFNFDTNQ